MTAVKDKGMIASFSKKGTPSNNACIEAFWSNFKRETINLIRKKDLSFDKVKEIITSYIHFYNYEREMQVLDGMAPLEYKNYYQKNPDLKPFIIKPQRKKMRRYYQ
ncbi:integrase core domain-containing protein [Candidatus Phytoplasma solani]|nr:integrase core domain-containing protein [Candidatus Phytoplasma solani]RMI88644.1 putative transposase [Candidatus Phytoplasma solani]